MTEHAALPDNIVDPTQDAPVAPQQVDYFGFQHEETFTLPDGISQITFQRMNEGAKSEFQKTSSRDLVLERQSGNARMKVDPGGDRHALIRASVTGWNLKRMGQPVVFHERSLKDFLTLADPQVIEDLEKAIRKANPWLLQDMSVEDIDREIESLQEMRVEAAKREEGKAS